MPSTPAQSNSKFRVTPTFQHSAQGNARARRDELKAEAKWLRDAKELADKQKRETAAAKKERECMALMLVAEAHRYLQDREKGASRDLTVGRFEWFCVFLKDVVALHAKPRDYSENVRKQIVGMCLFSPIHIPANNRPNPDGSSPAVVKMPTESPNRLPR